MLVVTQSLAISPWQVYSPRTADWLIISQAVFEPSFCHGLYILRGREEWTYCGPGCLSRDRRCPVPAGITATPGIDGTAECIADLISCPLGAGVIQRRGRLADGSRAIREFVQTHSTGCAIPSHRASCPVNASAAREDGLRTGFNDTWSFFPRPTSRIFEIRPVPSRFYFSIVSSHSG